MPRLVQQKLFNYSLELWTRAVKEEVKGVTPADGQGELWQNTENQD